MSNTKIVVIKLKQIIYGAIFAVLGIILIVLLITLFKSGNDDSSTTDDVAKYVPGKYTSVVSLNDTNLNLEIVVDENHINSVRIVNIDESITTMFPLVEPSINDISEQLCNDVDIASVEIAEESKYTQSLLLDAVEQTLAKALIVVTEE
jgi:2C-methyl-D-erythritol 2,4-cyclodiphosphate synthase